MDENEFQRVLVLVLVAGSIVAAVCVTAIVLLMRLAGKKTFGKASGILAAALFGFIFLCCAALFALSYLSDR